MTRRRRTRERKAYNKVRRAREGVGGALYAPARWDTLKPRERKEWCSLEERPAVVRLTRACWKRQAEAAWQNALEKGWVTDS
jgi:hypothetical protein